MNLISREALDFLEEAKNSFNNNGELITYTDSENEFIALRGGFRENCILIYELNCEVGNFTDQLPSRHKVLVDYDELDDLKKLKDNVENLKSLDLNRLANELDDVLKNDLVDGNTTVFDYFNNYLSK